MADSIVGRPAKQTNERAAHVNTYLSVCFRRSQALLGLTKYIIIYNKILLTTAILHFRHRTVILNKIQNSVSHSVFVF